MLTGVEAEVEIWVGVRGGVCFGVWLEVGPLAELETEDGRQCVGLWDLLKEGPCVAGTGDGVDVGVTV